MLRKRNQSRKETPLQKPYLKKGLGARAIVSRKKCCARAGEEEKQKKRGGKVGGGNWLRVRPRDVGRGEVEKQKEHRRRQKAPDCLLPKGNTTVEKRGVPLPLWEVRGKKDKEG